MRLRFGTRLTFLLLVLFVMVQLPTFSAFYLATRQNALTEARTRLDSAGRTFNELLRARGTQLLDAVQVTTSDFGFRRAVATEDSPTIRSALYNNGHRIGADLTLLLSLDGHVISSADADGKPIDAGDWSAVVKEAAQKKDIASMRVIGGKPYQIVMVPVFAPARIAWVAMGFALDQDLAQSLKNLALVDITFVGNGADGQVWSRSTLPDLDAAQAALLLSGSVGDKSAVHQLELGGKEYFTLLQPLAAGTAVLQLPTAAALSGFDLLERQLLILAALSLAASLCGAVWLSRNVTHPVAKLATAARRIEEGNYREEVSVSHDDELGDLAGMFNNMQLGISRREEQIAFQAFHDTLTGLPNRASLQKHLSDALEIARATRQPLALMMLDIDRFKEINDTMGHATGDIVLIEVGRRLRTALRPGDVLARFGGDEFVAILQQIDEAGVVAFAARVSTVVSQPLRAGSMEFFLDASIGVAKFPQHGERAEELLRRADIAMYDAKQSRKAFTVYEEGRDAVHLYRLSLLSDLRRAIGTSELELYYQPALDLHHPQIHRFEALLRWTHPQHGPISPADFIPLAEQSGLIRLITDWVLHEAIRQCAEWRDAGLDVGIAINLSAVDLGSGHLPDLLANHLGRYGVEPKRITLEITETAVMRDGTGAVEVLDRLKACGVRIAIDDFGTGYSSLSHLKRLPVDVLKIDKSFVMDMANDEDDAVIVRSTIELAHNMGLKVVAEGVETREAMAMLESLHCDSVQGYFICLPLAADKATSWLRRATPLASVTVLAERQKSV
ncbi:MAG: sensor domain-containing phosphodiesterase [Rudaea sp.]